MFIRIYREVSAVDASGDAPGSASTTVVLPDKGGAAAATPTAFTIPDAYKDKPYLKGVDSIDKVYGMLDGAQTLIGKRPAGIPAPDAAPEEWDKFYEAKGRPKTPAEYVLKDADKTDPDFLSAAQAAMHKRGLSPTEAAGLWDELGGALTKVAEKQGLAAKQLDIDFDKLGDEVFGANKNAILASSKILLDQNVSPKMKDTVAKLPNESLVVLADVINNIKTKYIKADGAPGSGPTATGSTPAEIQAKGRELMGSEAYNNFRHPQHKETVKQVKELYCSLNQK